MSDPITRLNEALEDGYTVERELGEGGHGHGVQTSDVGKRGRGHAQRPWSTPPAHVPVQILLASAADLIVHVRDLCMARA